MTQRTSYASGASAQALLGETIGANLERTAARVPGAEALVSCHQNLRYTYADRKSTRLNSSHLRLSRMPSSA